jgi:hypothetical protein
MESLNTLKEQRDYVWSYFQLHAAQRMSTFNFFIVISALLTTGLAGTFVKDFQWDLVGAALSFGLMIVSFVFWKLDQRVRFLIKHAESALKEIEEKWKDEIIREGVFLANLFSEEEVKTDRERERKDYRFWSWHLSYADCFEIVYCIFGMIGILGVLGSLLK